MQVQVTSSTDGGSTWSDACSCGAQQRQARSVLPVAERRRKGNVGVTWLDRRNDTSNINYEAFATWSSDGGSDASKPTCR